MKATKGKRLTDLTITLRVVVLPIAGYAFKDKAVEKWCIYRLTSDDQATRVMAAEKLATMRSLRDNRPRGPIHEAADPSASSPPISTATAARTSRREDQLTCEVFLKVRG